MKLLVLNSDDIKSVCSIELVTEMHSALANFSRGTSKNFSRVVHSLKNGQLGIMPSVNQKNIGCKIVSVFPENKHRGENPHQGMVSFFDSTTGKLIALLDGSMLTALRTAAVSAAATLELGNSDSKTLGIIGTGTQASHHLQMICQSRRIDRVFIYGRDPQKVDEFRRAHTDISIYQSRTPQELIRDADIIVSVTSSREPLFSAEDLKPGQHLNLVGACRPGFIEAKLYTRKGLRIFLDSRRSCIQEAEEIYAPLREGRLSEDSIVGEIGEVFSGQLAGRESTSDITIFKSVGLGIEDLAAAGFFAEKAKNLRKGQYVNF